MANGTIKTGMSINLLWTNPNPESAFAAQTVALDLSGYDAVLIDANSGTDRNGGKIFFCFVGRAVAMDVWMPSVASKYNRMATVATTGVTFGQGYFGTNVNNICIIPLTIYGVRL